jgi:hypothetical protein
MAYKEAPKDDLKLEQLYRLLAIYKKISAQAILPELSSMLN